MGFKVWVTGSRGLIGSALTRRLQALGIPWVGSGREVDVADPILVRTFLDDHSPDILINCAAWTDVDAAEVQEKACLRANVSGPENLGRQCRERGIRLVHFSSDFLFNSSPSKALTEEDTPNPRGVYARSKALGERALLGVFPQAAVLRTSWVYSQVRPNFVTRIFAALVEGRKIEVVDDQWGSPTWAEDSAAAALALGKDSTALGIFHGSGLGGVSRFGLAQKIQEISLNFGLIQRPVLLIPVSTKSIQGTAPRPLWSVLDCGKFTQQFPGILRPWEKALEEFLRLNNALPGRSGGRSGVLGE